MPHPQIIADRLTQADIKAILALERKAEYDPKMDDSLRKLEEWGIKKIGQFELTEFGHRVKEYKY